MATFDETVRIHSEGWKTGFCQCDWCNVSRRHVIGPTIEIDNKWRYADEFEAHVKDDLDAILNGELRAKTD